MGGRWTPSERVSRARRGVSRGLEIYLTALKRSAAADLAMAAVLAWFIATTSAAATVLGLIALAASQYFGWRLRLAQRGTVHRATQLSFALVDERNAERETHRKILASLLVPPDRDTLRCV